MSPPEPPSTTQKKLHRTMVVVGWGFFVTMLGQTSVIGSLPIKFLLKDKMHLKAHEMAAVLGLLTIAWYLKPFLGLLTDSFPFFGTRRRHYLILGSCAAMVLWIMLGMVVTRLSLFIVTAIALNFAVVLANTVAGGLLVEEGQRSGATGRLSSARVFFKNSAIIIAGPLVGYLALRPFMVTSMIGATLFFSLSFLSFLMLREASASGQVGNAWITARRELSTLLRMRPLWIAAGMVLLVELAPGFHTPLFYFQTDKLHFDAQFMGTLTLLSGLFGLFAAFLYGYACKHFSLQTLLVFAILCASGSTFSYLGYHSRLSAILIESTAGLFLALANLPLFDLAARATPRGSEALGYSLIMSIWNFGIMISDVSGSWLYDHFGLNFMSLVWLNAGTTALALLAVPFLPKRMIDGSDSELSEPLSRGKSSPDAK